MVEACNKTAGSNGDLLHHQNPKSNCNVIFISTKNDHSNR